MPSAVPTGIGSGRTVEAKRGRSPSPLGGSTAGDAGSGGPPASPERSLAFVVSSDASSISVRPTGAGGSSSASSAIGTGGRSARSMPSLARSTSSTGATRSSGPPIDASHEAQR